MIVYSATKKEFNDDVIYNQISDKVLNLLREKNIQGGSYGEYRSWQNSLSFMRNVIDDVEIPNDVKVAIEYQIPRTSKRVDFIITGTDKNNHNNVVIIELKQWEKAELVDDIMEHSVRTYVGGANRMESHPSYQAYAYSIFIKNSSEQVQDEDIGIIPCAYLHNYDPKYADVLSNEIYKDWYEEAPFFIKNQVSELRSFIKKYIFAKSNDDNLLYKIDNGRIRPSKALQDCLVSLMKGNKEFMLLDEQAVIYDMCKKTMDQCHKDLKKRTMIIQGGPGTGKSVLAINLLKDLISKQYNAAYCTKNSAPRDAYINLLTNSDLKKQVNIKMLFRSPFNLSKSPRNFYDCLIVDEAHRLVKKMYGDWSGENQIKECINSSLFTIFLIDEDQRITTKDIGSIEEIEKYALELDSRVINNEHTVLSSQFRCNGSDLYLQLINNVLQTGEHVDIDVDDLNFEFKVFDNPNEFRDALREKNQINNKARMVAGYCYDWNVKNKRDEYDIYLEDGFKAKWNLESDKIWAINKNSFEEVGCIHTAQGLEFDYVGVIIGKDLAYNSNTGKVETNKFCISKDDKSSGIKNAKDEVAEKLIKNTYKTLLTRGQKGCYVYCEDKQLSEYIKNYLNKHKS